MVRKKKAHTFRGKFAQGFFFFFLCPQEEGILTLPCISPVIIGEDIVHHSVSRTKGNGECSNYRTCCLSIPRPPMFCLNES